MSQADAIERRLAAVLAADVAGFSRLTEADEVGTMRMLAAQRAILDAAIARHRGRIANTAGDSVLAEFPSAVNAVQCAVEAQQALRENAEDAPVDRRVLFRIGIHVGDVMVRGGDLLGNGVNVAARLEALADAGGIVLSSAAHEQVKRILPLVYTDLGPQSVKNIEEPVRAYAIGAMRVAPVAALPGDGKPLPMPNKPSIAVLPFQNMSGDPEQEYFADGLVEDIITALSRFKSLFVIARNSSFTYKGKAVDIKQVGRELGVRYVLEGSVRKSGGRVRITGQLIEAVSGVHLWADKFEGTLEDVFELQDRVTGNVVAAIAPRLIEAEIERIRQKPTDSLNAYDIYLRGSAHARRFEFRKALTLYREAIVQDPDYARAYALVANCLMSIQSVGGVLLDPDERAAAIDAARRAAELGQDDAQCLAMAGHSLAYWRVDYDLGAALVEHAITLNPNLLAAWVARGWIGVINCESERAIESFSMVTRLSPVDPARFYAWNGIAWAYFISARYEEGCRWATLALQGRPSVILFAGFIANAVYAGRLKEAQEMARKLVAFSPAFRVEIGRDAFPSRYPEMVAKIREAMVTAGLPE